MTRLEEIFIVALMGPCLILASELVEDRGVTLGNDHVVFGIDVVPLYRYVVSSEHLQVLVVGSILPGSPFPLL